MVPLFDSLRFAWMGGLRSLHSGASFTLHSWKILNAFSQEKPNHKEAALALREVFESLGATYIKLGQFIASAPSFFPEEYVTEMQRCLDSVRPVPFRAIRSTIERELNGKLEDFFLSVEEKPLASASIAQVHAATTRDGLDVVIKVQRPDIENTLQTDMQILGLLTKALGWIAPELKSAGFTGMLDEFQTSILGEVDFFKEAFHMEEFEKHLLDAGESRARVPKVYHPLSTKRILTMERFYGVPITDEVGLKSFTKEPRKVINTALEIWFSSLGRSGFFHADVHAGNLMVLRDGTIGFLDFGIVGRISPQVWKGLLLFSQGLGTGDSESIALGLVSMDSTNPGVDPKKLAKDLSVVFQSLEGIYENIATGSVTELEEERMNHIVFQMKEIAEKNGLKIPREFALLMKQMLYFDRYVKRMAPEINIFRDGQRFLQ